MVSLNFDWFRNIDGDNGILGRNISWLYNYLSPSGVVSGEIDLLDKFRRSKSTFSVMNMAVNQFSWAYLYDRIESFPAAIDFFMENCSSDVVIGYELSRAQRRLLTDLGKTYIDLRTHPIRFLPDYHLSAGTNNAEIHNRLVSLAPPKKYVDTSAFMHKARAARRYQKRLDPDFGVVFFAQTAFDSSRIRNGEMLDDSYIVDALESYLEKEKPKNIYFKSHPHEPIRKELASSLSKLGAKETKTASYDLLSVEGLRVCALSSSVCHEATYFGGRPTVFHPPEDFPQIGTDGGLGSYSMMPANLYEAEIWNFILNGDGVPEPYYPLSPAPFRMASGLSWG
ncbi:hypothetical protein [Agrobacterium sp. OT33]|uniref:hypothetical protein n=1 Tax=Agrobacterium sp. OT33 TaxID=2815338 RepID=UPI001A8C777F|nr:hypothetical protein [Agrobacterium sp. OT33]MBO0125231.1 hypothetical protein [Agrobacterium sp. OT33]